jgi:hypothetical protein
MPSSASIHNNKINKIFGNVFLSLAHGYNCGDMSFLNARVTDIKMKPQPIDLDNGLLARSAKDSEG